jgi:diguanylate cyclase (GGDEF)-like protein/PAS domain S-box-containing protein
VTPRPTIDAGGASAALGAVAPHAGLDPGAFEQLFLHAGGLLAILDEEGRFVAVNPACERVLGSPPESLIGKLLVDFVAPHEPSSGLRTAAALLPPAAAGTDTGTQDDFVELLARHPHADGSWRWLLWSGTSADGRGYACAKDVTDWIGLEHRVGRDPLTQLPNREVFTAELTHAIARHERASSHLGVLFIDVDSFKQINDSVGHEAGDLLLAEVAARLRATVRGGDIVARLGGDEFVILAQSLVSEHEIATLADRVVAAFQDPLELESGPLSVSASIGVATAAGPPATAEGLIHDADTAMYRAKAAGRNRYAIFDAGLRSEVEHRIDVERDLRAALTGGQFVLHYQPIVNLADEAVVGVEALLRWEHPSRGLVLPADFIPLAEQNGLIVELGAWALVSALSQAAKWEAAGHELSISINVSSRQLADDALVDLVKGALADSGVRPDRVCLEVTETAILDDPARAAARLDELRQLGVRIAFDDFGTGYSSLRHLIELPVDEIKLDRSFVSGLVGDQARPSRAILIAVIAAARELEIGVVAEGVELEVQLTQLRAVGCDRAQGLLFSRPLPAEELSFAPRAARAAA